VLPVVPDDWLDANRAIASFLPHTQLVVPADLATMTTPGWRQREDWQLLENLDAYPRTWLVHDLRFRKPTNAGTDESRAIKKSLLHQADLFWTLPDREVENPRVTAWVETDDPKLVGLRGDSLPAGPSETAAIVLDRPDRMEIDANLDRDGFLVVADTFAPGWVARVDGNRMPIWRTNRSMRGVALAKGRHRVVFSYEPGSFRMGLVASGLGFIACVALWRMDRSRHMQERG
jgi:hypothetical protein